MIHKLINKLQKEGKIRKQKAGIIQVEALLKDAMSDLKEAKVIAQLAQKGNLYAGIRSNAKSRQSASAFKWLYSR